MISSVTLSLSVKLPEPLFSPLLIGDNIGKPWRYCIFGLGTPYCAKCHNKANHTNFFCFPMYRSDVYAIPESLSVQ